MINEVLLQPARCLSMNVQVCQPSTLKKRKINKIRCLKNSVKGDMMHRAVSAARMFLRDLQARLHNPHRTRPLTSRQAAATQQRRRRKMLRVYRTNEGRPGSSE